MFHTPPGRSHCLQMDIPDGGYRKVVIDGVEIPAMLSDDAGVGPFVSTVTGWLDPASGGVSFTDLALTSGAMYPAKITRSHHEFTLTGYCDGASSDVEDFAAWLAALAYRMVVVGIQGDGGQMTYRTCLCKSELSEWSGGNSFSWSLDCIAPDPIRYGDWSYSTATGTSATVSNAGTAPTKLFIEAVKTASSILTITAPNGQTIYTTAAAGTVRFDPTAGGSITLNGAPSLGVKALNWPTVPAKGSVTVQMAGATSWRIGVRDGWW